jgi:hypothetical protein
MIQSLKLKQLNPKEAKSLLLHKAYVTFDLANCVTRK